MALFRRKRQEDVLPDEVRDYYKTEERNRSGTAWLMAAGGFILTVVIIFALFFAGRWAYQAIFVGDDDETTEVTAPNDEDVDDEDTPFIERNDNDEADNNNDNDNDVDDGEADAPRADRDQEATNDNDLPRTGPAPRE